MGDDRKLICFVCPSEFESIENLCKHIQNIHKIRGQNCYQCKLCMSVLGDMDGFKKHLARCLRKTRKLNVQRIDHNNIRIDGTENSPSNGGVSLRMFEESIHESALKLALKLSSDMSLPRESVFKIIGHFREHIITAFMKGIENVIVPQIVEMSNVQEQVVEAFLQICSGTFCYVDTEPILDSTLRKADLIHTLIKFPIGVVDKKSHKITEENVSGSSDIEEQIYDQSDVGFNISQDSPGELGVEEHIHEQETIYNKSDESDESDTRFDKGDERIKVSTGSLMPIQFQLRKFFEQKDVFKIIMENTNKIRNANLLNHFINGELWKSKLSAFTKDQIVIPYHLYSDETQVNNALGTHCAPGLENCVYYSFPTIPVQYASRLRNIFVAMLSSAADTTKFGPDACFESLVHELNSLARDGVKITVDGKEETIYFVLGLFLGDNASLNKILGFCAFSATIFCKHCRMKKVETQTETVEHFSMIRNEENYNEDLLIDDEKKTGIKWNSIFNIIFLFHVTHSAGVDIMHDLSEGVLRYHMCSIIHYFIRTKAFTLKTLNHRKRNFIYDYADRGNKSADITMKKLRSGKLTMTASEMMTFTNMFRFLVGDLISTNDEVWKFYLKTVEVVDLVFLTSFKESDLLKLKNSINEMNEMYKSLFNQTLKPKHHFLTHYPRLTRLFGPLRYISSIRYEAKHRMIKKYTKNTESRKNISFSIARKLQYDFANILNAGDGLKDKLDYKQTRNIILSSQDFFGHIESSSLLDEIANTEIFETEYLTINGIFFSNKLFIPEMSSTNEINVLKIDKILLFPRCDQIYLYLLCKKYSKTLWCAHYASYEITELHSGDLLTIKSVHDLLDMHILPMSLQSFKGKEMFRLRN